MAVLMCHIIDISTLSKISVNTLAPMSYYIDVVYHNIVNTLSPMSHQ